MATKAKQGAASAENNGAGPAVEPDQEVQPEGIPVGGKLYTTDDLTGTEQRIMRQLLREATGKEDATLGDFVRPVIVEGYVVREPQAEWFDLVTAFRYVINRRGDENYSIEQAGDFNPGDEYARAAKLTEKKQSRRRPPQGSSSGS